MIGNATHCAYGKVIVTVGSDVAAEEAAEVINYNGTHFAAIRSLKNMWSQGCEETVGQRFAIDTLYN